RLMHVRHDTAVTGEAGVRTVWRWRCDRFGTSLHPTRLLVDGEAPEIHATAAVTGEVEMLSIRRPGGTPVRISIVRDRSRGPFRIHRYCQDVPPAATRAPKRDAVPTGRPMGLHSVPVLWSDRAFFTGRNTHHKETAQNLAGANL